MVYLNSYMIKLIINVVIVCQFNITQDFKIYRWTFWFSFNLPSNFLNWYLHVFNLLEGTINFDDGPVTIKQICLVIRPLPFDSIILNSLNYFILFFFFFA